MRRFLAIASAIVADRRRLYQSGSTPAPSHGGTGTARDRAGRAARRRQHGAERRRVRPGLDHRHATLSGWQSSDAENAALTATVAAFQAAYPNVKVDYKVIAGDYADGHGHELRARRTSRTSSTSTRAFAQPWSDNGLPRAARRLHREVGLRHEHVLPRLPVASFKGADGKTYGLPKDGNTIGMAYNTAEVDGRAEDARRARDRRDRPEGQGRPEGADVPEPRSRPRPGVRLRPGRLDRVRRRHDQHGRHARDEGRRPVVSRPVQERHRHDRERHGRRLVRRRARQEARRDHVRGRLARPGDDLDASRTSSTPGARSRPARPAAR